MLNLTIKNLRQGTFTKNHVMVDVELNGKFISTYECNPLYQLDTEGETFNLIVNAISRSSSKYDAGTARYLLEIYCGKHWNKDLYDNTKEIFMKIILEKLKDKVLGLIDLKDVERCLFNDAECFEFSSDFEDFCFNFGLDTDSIKALKVYEGCKEIYLKLVQTIGSEKLREGIEYYREN